MTNGTEVAGTETPIRIERRGSLAVVTIDNPPVNATSAAVRKGLLDAVNEIAADPALTGAVITGAGRNFIGGADIREFGKPLTFPQTPDVIAAIEACPKPFAVAIRGVALGGGLELSLGCDARVATPDAVVGLPEVTLGFIPGAGGTQRLPRLVGFPAAVDIVASGRRLKAGEAAELGLLDEVVDGDPVAAAVAGIGAGRIVKRRLRDLAVPPLAEAEIDKATTAALARARGKAWVAEAVAMTRKAFTMPIDAALVEERETFQRLRVKDEAFALRHLFFAERAAGRIEGLDRSLARPVERAVVIGGGGMGSGIAVNMLSAGIKVTLIERDDAALNAGAERVRGIVEKAVTTGHASREQADQHLAAFSASLDPAAMGDADLVLEAVFEDMDVKGKVMADAGRRIRPDAVLASNTSYLDLNLLAETSGRPAQVVGLHFFMPPHIMKLLEVVRGAKTDDATLATALAVGRQLGKIAVVAGVGEGFIGNAIYAEYRRHCEYMLEEGAYPEDVDNALEAFGFAMGPFRVTDFSGLDVSWNMRKSRAASRDPRERYVAIPDQLCEMGRFGRKTGAGWYRYGDDGKATPDPAVRALIEAASIEKGITRRPIPADEIVARALGAMVNRAALLLADGIAQAPADIDVVMANGYGFPRHKGGPVFWASRQPADALAATIDRVAEAAGFGFRRGDIAAMLGKLTQD